MNTLEPITSSQFLESLQRLSDMQQQLVSGELKLSDLPTELQTALTQRKALRILDTHVDQAYTEATFDLPKEVETWLQSYHTQSKVTYQKNIRSFLTFLENEHLSIVRFDMRDAIRFVDDLMKKNWQPATVKHHLAAASSLCSYLTDLELLRKNPFASRHIQRPKIRRTQKHVPTATEVETIVTTIAEDRYMKKGKGAKQRRDCAIRLYPAILCIVDAGLRVDALRSLEIDPTGQCYGWSKEKEVVKQLPKSVLDAIRQSELTLPRPFGNIPTETTRCAFFALTKRLYRAEKIAYPYSIHTLRHFAAVREYTRTRDIDYVCRFLGHADIRTTQIYLHSRGIVL